MPATAASPSDRRIAPRRRPTLGTICHLDSAHASEPELGLVWNISTTGITMLLTEAPQSGAMLTGTLVTMDGMQTRKISVRVVHIRKLQSGDYLIGGAFSEPMTPDEQRPFVA